MGWEQGVEGGMEKGSEVNLHKQTPNTRKKKKMDHHPFKWIHLSQQVCGAIQSKCQEKNTLPTSGSQVPFMVETHQVTRRGKGLEWEELETSQSAFSREVLF